jgi:site-specific recombinase XerD
MIDELLSIKYQEWHRESRHRDRIDHVTQALLKLEYLPVVIRGHMKEWLRFTKYLDDREIDLPTTVHDPIVKKYIKCRFPKGSDSRFRCIRASIRILIDTDDQGRFPRRMQAPVQSTTALYNDWACQYLRFIRKYHCVSEKTVSKRAYILAQFMKFVEGCGISTLNDIGPSLIRDYCISLESRKPLTRLGYASAIRGFFKWAFQEGLIKLDLAPAVFTAKHYKYTGLPDVLTEEEVETILRSTNRSTIIGKRDYAVLLLAARYGMRPSDIRQISLESINWRASQIMLHQSKTGQLLALPLLPDVRDALLDYLRNGRPKTHSRRIFVRHLAPFEPFVSNNNLSSIMRPALRRAGLQDREGRRGLYLFRHTLATRLLEAGQPLKIIADILGHNTIKTTFLYTKVDLLGLQKVAMSIKEITQ